MLRVDADDYLLNDTDKGVSSQSKGGTGDEGEIQSLRINPSPTRRPTRSGKVVVWD
jgi:hypothetical protein